MTRLDSTSPSQAAVVRAIDKAAADAYSAESFEAALHILALQSRLAIGAHQTAISFIPDGDFLAAVHTHSFSEKYERFNSYDVMPTGEGIWGLIVNQQRSVCMTDDELTAHPQWKDFSGLKDARGLEHPPMRGWLAVPIVGTDDRMLGVLQASDRFEGEFTLDDLEPFQHLAAMMAPTFELQYVNRQLLQRTDELHRRNEELEAARAELQQARDELEHRVRQRTLELECSNQALDEFAHVVSHDLKAPLRSIISLAQWFSEDFGEVVGAEGQEQLQLLNGRARRMNGMIEGILTYSRTASVETELVAVDSGQVAREVIETLAPPPEIVKRIDDSLPVVVFDRMQFEQILQNLIGNGITHLGQPSGEVVVSCRETPSHWEFQVTDTGVGIAQEHHERIFQVFRTLKSRDELDTTGIGLALVRRIVERCGGTIRVESKLGAGSRFSFTILKSLQEDQSTADSAGEAR